MWGVSYMVCEGLGGEFDVYIDVNHRRHITLNDAKDILCNLIHSFIHMYDMHICSGYFTDSQMPSLFLEISRRLTIHKRHSCIPPENPRDMLMTISSPHILSKHLDRQVRSRSHRQRLLHQIRFYHEYGIDMDEHLDQ